MPAALFETGFISMSDSFLSLRDCHAITCSFTDRINDEDIQEIKGPRRVLTNTSS